MHQERVFLEHFFISNSFSEYSNNIKVQIRKKTRTKSEEKTFPVLDIQSVISDGFFLSFIHSVLHL